MSTDPFREVVDLLFGDGADELIAKMNPDGADLGTHAKRKNRERTEARIGLASNVVGLAAGVAGTRDAYTSFKEHKRTASGSRLLSSTKVSGKTKALTGGLLGLQVANVAGDAVANRVLARSAKKDPNVKGGTQTAVRVGTDEAKKAKDKFGKGIEEIKENASFKGGKLTRAKVTSPSRAHGKGAEFQVKGGKVKCLPNKTQTVKKSDEIDVRWEGEFSKVDTDKQQVFGWASIVELDGEPVVDLQGDYIAIDEVEKSAYEYVHKSRRGGDMHLRDGEEPVVKSHMIESFVVTPEKKAALGLPEEMPTGWWVGYQVNDPDLWGMVKDGKRTGFSIHGRGVRTPA